MSRQSRSPDVLVTLADSNYLQPAKQLFSSAYHQGGWTGDYLLLAHDVPDAELAWFRDRGILVRPCEALSDDPIGGMPPVLGSKLYVFAPEFRRWRTIVYLDADASVRASLASLAGIRGFHAVRDWNPVLGLQIANRGELAERGIHGAHLRAGWNELAAYDRRAPAFCAGFFAFGSEILDDSMFPSLLGKLRRLGSFSRFGDQLIVNLELYGRWRELSPIHHLLLWNGRPPWPLRRDAVDAFVFHFVGSAKPWNMRGHDHEEWSRNLARAEEIDLGAIPPGHCWSMERTRRTSRALSRSMVIGALARRCAAPLRRLG